MCFVFICDLCHLHHKLIGFYNQDEKCLPRGTNWAFKQSSLPFVFKGLCHTEFVAKHVKPLNATRSLLLHNDKTAVGLSTFGLSFLMFRFKGAEL